MKIVVDANIVFSAILNTNGKIGDLLINSKDSFDFIAPDFLRHEINNHKNRILKIAKYTENEYEEIYFQLLKNIVFVSEVQIIGKNSWVKAVKLVEDIDIHDAPYIALAIHFKCKLWSGDKELWRGLNKKGFEKLLLTDDLFKLRKAKLK